MKHTPLLLGAALSLVAASTASAQATFTAIGGNSTRPTNMSADGQWITGYDFNGGFRWNAGAGFTTFATGSNGQPDIAAGGSPVAVSLINGGGDEEAGLWTPGGTTFLGGLGGQSGTSISSAYGCNGDGTVVVGLGWINAGTAHAFKWTSGGSMVDLGAAGGNSSRANDVSGDGTVTVGWDEHATGHRRPAIWNGTTVNVLSDNPGEVWAVSTDGSYVGGIENKQAFRWDATNGTLNLGKLPGSVGGDDAQAFGVSDDGNTVVGYNGNAFFGTPFRAFIWRPGAGMVVLQDLVTALGGTIPAGFADLSIAAAVSADGNTICGQSGAFPFGPFEGWVLELPDVATTYCTAKVNSAGCTPAIGFSGTPSASSGAGFNVTAADILANHNGLLFYGVAGSAAIPFQGGLLCVAPPVLRTPGQNSGGTSGCDGSFDIDFNAYIPGSGDASLVGGATVWAQYWSRDTGFAPPNNTNLTDGIEFTLWP